MQRWSGASATPDGWGSSVCTIGVFDGVHRGHARVIRRVVNEAARLRAKSLVVTFDPHPMAVVAPNRVPPLLTSLEQKAELIAELGVDGLCVLPFTPDFARMSPEGFVDNVLIRSLHSSKIIVGENFRFGHRASGDVALLTEVAEKHHVIVEALPIVSHNDGHLSSSRIRLLLGDGDVASAADALGRPYRLVGVVGRGEGRGHSLGFPTANIAPEPGAALPGDGIYAGWLYCGAESWPAAVSIGSNPTFAVAGEQPVRRIEAHLLDVDVDLYGAQVSLDFVARHRDTEAFATQEALSAQIAEDVRWVRRTLS